MPQILVVIIRGTFAFFTLLIFARAMGKEQVSQLTLFDYITGITIGSIAASMTTDLSIETLASFAGMGTWVFWVLVLSIGSSYSRKFSKTVSGEPTVVGQNGQILEANLKQLGYTLDDLRMQLRQKNAFNMADVEFALLEPDGSLSVQLKSQLQPVTPSDLNLPTQYKGLATELIIDGHIVEENLTQMKLTKEWLISEIEGRNHKVSDVYYAELDTQGRLYVDLRDDIDGLPEDQDVSE